MEYKKASEIRRTGLLKLIAENKFQKGRGITASIGGAISDKFKAKATGIKESLDPLNLVRKMTGGGVIGKSIRTIAGRAMGRSEEDIEYFGGYANQRRKRKQKSRKDPLISSIGAGEISSVRVGDGAADILAKMYNFMQKSKEQEKLRYELDKAFRDEQLDEDERRHKKLIESILERTNQTPIVQPEEDKESPMDKFTSFLGKGIGAVLKGILASIKFLGSMITKILGILLPLASKLVTTIFKVITENAMTIFKLLLPGIMSLTKSLLGAVLRLIPGTAAAIGVLGLGALTAGNAVIENENRVDFARSGSEIDRIKSEMSAKENEYNASQRGMPDLKAKEKFMQNLRNEYQPQMDSALKKYEEETLIPAMAKIGFEPETGKNARDKNKGGLLNFRSIKDPKIKATSDDYKRAIYGENYKDKQLMEFIFGQFATPEEMATNASNTLIDSAKDRVSSAVDTLTAPVSRAADSLREFLPTNTDVDSVFRITAPTQSSSSPNSQVNVSNNTNNVPGSRPEVVSGDSANARDVALLDLTDMNSLGARGGQ